MTEEIIFAVIGSGFMGSVLARCSHALPYARCVATMDVVEERAQKLAASCDGNAYTDYTEMLDKEQPDVVFVATPEDDHLKPVLAASQQGCHVFCEKPIALTLGDADAIIKACADANVKLMIGYGLRFEVNYVMIKAAIDEGRIGRFLSAYGRRIGTIQEARRLGGRVTPGQYIAVHDIDIMMWYHPEPVRSVYARAVRGKLWEELGTYDSAWIMIEFADGALGIHEVGLCLPEKWANWEKPTTWAGFGDIRMNVIGTEGVINLNFTPMNLYACDVDGWKLPDTRHWAVMHGKPVGAIKIESYLLDKYPNLLGGGIWGAGKLIYRPPDPEERFSRGEVWLTDFKPMQVASLDLDYFCEERSQFTLNEWRELLVNSMGFNPEAYAPSEQLLLLTRLLPIIQPRVNLVELSPKGTGKSFIYQNLSRYVRLISGGKVTAPVLFYNLASNTPGLLTQYDLVVFDEAQTISFSNPGEVVGVLKDYLESGRYTRGKQQATADSGVMFLANIPIDSSGYPRQPVLFYNLPRFLQETAFIDRIHGILPGWKLRRIKVDSPARGMGFKADFFSEVLHALRDRGGYAEYVSAHLKITGTDDMRDKKAIERLAAGYLRLFFPDIQPTPSEFYEYCVKPSVALRQRIRDQLSRMDPEYKVLSISAEVT